MPPPYAYKTVTGTYLAPDGAVVAGSIRFIPSETVYDSTGSVVVPPVPVTVTLDGSGQFSEPLLVTDDPGTNPTGWVWRVAELFAGGREYEFSLPSSSPSTVDITDLTPVTTVDVTYAYATLASVASLSADIVEFTQVAEMALVTSQQAVGEMRAVVDRLVARIVAAEESAALAEASVIVHPLFYM